MASSRYILGLNVFHGDSSAALIADGHLLAAAEEERFTREKHAAGVPFKAIAYVLDEAGIDFDQLDAVALGRDQRAHLLRKIAYVATHPGTLRSNVGQRQKLRNSVADVPRMLGEAFDVPAAQVAAKTVAVEHHLAHLASAYYLSGFQDAAVISIDGFGDFVSTMWAQGDAQQLSIDDAVYFPHSLGILYQAVTQYIGYPHYGDEGKVMGLAPYGEPRFVGAMHSLIRGKPNGKFALNPRFFRHANEGIETDFSGGAPKVGPLFNSRWQHLFGRGPRSPAEAADAPMDEWAKDMAYSVQTLCERFIFDVLRQGYVQSSRKKLCLAGGVALNSVANGKALDMVGFDQMYIQPAAGDDGIAIGAAAYVSQQRGRQVHTVLEVPLTGPKFAQTEIDAMLANHGIVRKDEQTEQQLCVDGVREQVQVRWWDDEQQLCDETAALIARELVVGWFHGRMEFGPRALGGRSILADPRSPRMKEILNARIKHREPYRPFAPSVLEEHTAQWFERDYPSPAMLMVYPLRKEKRHLVPAITHVDGTGRLQTVSARHSPRYARLIQAFYEATGVPMVLNTSFNENEPIVHTPLQALECFARTRMDVLVLEHCVLQRTSSIQSEHNE